jgi:hypothetical protein
MRHYKHISFGLPNVHKTDIFFLSVRPVRIADCLALNDVMIKDTPFVWDIIPYSPLTADFSDEYVASIFRDEY